jgi:hypothetical protein
MTDEHFDSLFAERREKLVDNKDQQTAERGLAAIAKKTDSILRAIPSELTVLSSAVKLFCPRNTLGVNLAVRVASSPSSKNLRVPVPNATFAEVRPFVASASEGPRSVALNAGAILIDTKGMTAGDLYALDVEVPLKTQGLVNSLVRRDAAVEAPKSTESEYWMSAQLRSPDSLLKRYPGGFDLRDVQFTVMVSISEHIKSVVPQSFIDELETAVDLLAERDPRKKDILGRRHVIQMRRRGEGSPMELLGNLQAVFFPDSFRKFVDVLPEFEYETCEPGLSFYDTLPFPTWPRSMMVTSRANLSVGRWSARGLLRYRREDFLGKVREVLGI